MKLRFVSPQVTRIDLGDGEWIEVRKELTAGEARRAMARTVSTVDMTGRVTPNLEQLGKSEVIAYLLDWSARDAADKPIPVSEDAIDNLSGDAYKLIADKIEEHVKSVEAEAKKAITANT